MTIKNDPPIEIDMTLPEILEGPVELPSGGLVAVGDKVDHAELGIGESFESALTLTKPAFCFFATSPAILHRQLA
jgi:hypothetical protein